MKSFYLNSHGLTKATDSYPMATKARSETPLAGRAWGQIRHLDTDWCSGWSRRP